MKGNNFRAGIFVFLTLCLLVFIVMRIGKSGGMLFGGTYPVFMDVETAVGLSRNTPVQIAGVGVGVVESISLTENSKARLKLAIRDEFKISSNAEAHIKTTGLLGDAYIEIFQPGGVPEEMVSGGKIGTVVSYGDFNSVTNQFAEVAKDVSAITKQMRKLMAGDDSSFDRTMKNIEKISQNLANLTSKNEKNIDAIISNMKTLSQNLNVLVANNAGHINNTVYNLDDITAGINRGEGTVGKLIKDDTTVNKINDTLDEIHSFLGGTNRLTVDLGMHSEYLAGTGDFKNYVSLYLKPRPDKFFLFDVISDPDPSFNNSLEEKTITSGGTSTTITTQTRTKNLNGFLFSAQVAKKFHDFTLRGGLIESSGGVGVDYDHGPFGLKFSAFDFRNDNGEKPHLKIMGTANMTRTFYLLGGVDDMINPNQDLAWFLGAGITFTDDDIKSLLGLLSAGMK